MNDLAAIMFGNLIIMSIIAIELAYIGSKLTMRKK